MMHGFNSNFGRWGNYGRSTYAFCVSLFSTQMTPITFFMDFYVYPIFIMASFAIGLWGLWPHVGWWQAPTLLLTGYAMWTLIEYLMHRFAFHHMPYVVDLHMAHHRDVNGMIGAPTILSFALMFGFCYLPTALLIGGYLACLWFAGLMAGYLAFSSVHYIVHHAPSGGLTVIRKLKRAHAIHHHGNNQYNFGVTTLIWDRVFGTYSEKMR